MSEVKDDIRPWADDASCHPRNGHDAAWWFPEAEWSHLHPYVKAAKAVCKECPVQELCLEYALDNEAYGIWGGFTERQREAFRRHEGMPLMKANSRRRMKAKETAQRAV